MTEGPATRYYRSLIGAWRGRFQFHVTDEAALRVAGAARWPATLMAWMNRWLGSATMSTTLQAADADGRAFLHTTRVTKWGIALYATAERIEIADGGRSFTMSGEQGSWPLPRARYDARGEIGDDADRATYRIPWMGVDLEQRTLVNELGLLLVQQTAFSRGEVQLRRRDQGSR